MGMRKSAAFSALEGIAMPKAAKRKSATPLNPKPRDRRVRGQKIFAAIHQDRGKQVVAGLRAIAPEFADMINDFAFGEIYARPG